jgi:hypothetical protein
MGRNEWSFEQPLRAVRRVVKECDGVVIVAFTRYSFESGTEQGKGGEKLPLTGVQLPTVWNQIEATMGYVNELPLLVIAEHGLKSEGLLEARYDWQVFWTDFAPGHFRTDHFVGFLDSWKRHVIEQSKLREAHSKELNLDLSKITVRQLIGYMSIGQVWSTLSAIVGLIVSVATIAYRIGANKWPWQ